MWKVGALVAAALLGLPSGAQAAPVSFSLTETPAATPGLLMNATVDEYSFTFDITQPAAGDGGYNPFTDTLSSAAIEFVFADDSDTPAEHVWVSVDSTMLVNNQPASTTYTFTSGSVATLLSSLLDGVLNVVITRQNGDFYFVSSSLDVLGDRSAGQDPTSTPEPISIGFVGLGLLGVALARRRRSA